MCSKILVPLDGSTVAEQVLRMDGRASLRRSRAD
jgi:hypothetical protein